MRVAVFVYILKSVGLSYNTVEVFMKKLTIFLIVLAVCVCACACKSPIEKWESSLSEVRDEVMTASGEGLSAVLMSGVREDPFVIDGVSGKKVDFTVITVTPISAEEDATFSYTLFADGKKYSGELNKHPFKGTWSAEIAVRTVDSATLTIAGESSAQTLELKSVKSDDMIGVADVLEITEVRLKKQIKELGGSSKLRAEIYVRLLSNPISADEGYYWYVGVAVDDSTVYALLIDPVTREIVASRE